MTWEYQTSIEIEFRQYGGWNLGYFCSFVLSGVDVLVFVHSYPGLLPG